jgi:hypothetical protein
MTSKVVVVNYVSTVIDIGNAWSTILGILDHIKEARGDWETSMNLQPQ